MTAQIIDGKAIADRILDDLRTVRAKLGKKPVRLVSLEIGDNPAAGVYMRNQGRAAAAVGIEFEMRHLPPETSIAGLTELISDLNDDAGVTGIIVQRPLPDLW